MPCEPAPPCEPNFPLFCEPLPTTNEGKRLVVEDSASCQKTIPTTPTPSILKAASSGNLEWEGGSIGSVLSYTTDGNIEFVDGSSSDPFKLPSLQSHSPDNIPNVMVMLADGTVTKWNPSNVGNNFLAYWNGSNWKINTLNNLLPSGNGVFIRDTSGNLVVVPNGISGSTLQMVGSNIQFVAAPSNQFPGGHIYGLTISNNVSDPNNDIDIAVGECRSATNTVDFILTSALTKASDAPWAAGTNQGGMDTGVKPNNGTLHVYIIGDGSNVDAIFSQSAVSPTLPGGYTQYRRIGAVTTDSSGLIRKFVQFGDRFLYTGKPIADATAASTNVGGTLISLTVPSGIKVFPIVNATDVNQLHTFYDPDSTWPSTNTVWSSNGAGYILYQKNVSYSGFSPIHGVMTNTVRQIGVDTSANTTSFYLDTYGWFDNRGRLQP